MSRAFVLNLPTVQGAELGRELSRLAEPVIAASGYARCDDCAFRLGTTPNQCPQTLMDAIGCLRDGEPFYCHKGVKQGDKPKQLCAGYAALRARDGGGES